jgi:hypothetical protein
VGHRNGRTSRIKAIIHPLRDGNNGGQFMAVTLPNGTRLRNPNAALSANAGGANAGPGIVLASRIDIPHVACERQWLN